MVWDLRCFEDFEEKDCSLIKLIKKLMSDGGVCRIALTTPGLLVAYSD